IFRLDKPAGRPVKMIGTRPADGALVMILGAAGDSGKLAVWTGGQQDRGVVVSADGAVAGFARYGQFLDAANAKIVIDQIVQYGKVRRATLGVIVSQSQAPDGRRALHVERVMPGSAAAAAGVAEGDYVLSFANQPVGDLPNFAAVIAAREGATKMQLLRGSDVVEVTVELKPK
ncbi:MAG: PDZ domain-containing protein, partial [Tepidisphaeraceae bacterium]